MEKMYLQSVVLKSSTNTDGEISHAYRAVYHDGLNHKELIFKIRNDQPMNIPTIIPAQITHGELNSIGAELQ